MNVSIWVSDDCNCKCDYCYEDKCKRHNMMSEKTALEVVNFIRSKYSPKNDQTLQIRIIGGEPLLNFGVAQKLMEGIKEIFPENVIFDITTNGTLISNENCNYISEIFSSVSISIDGLPQYHNKHRKFNNGTGTYDKVLEGFKKLDETKTCIIGRMTITEENVSYLYQNVSHLVDLGFTVIEPVPDFTSKRWNNETGEILRQQFIKLVSLQKELNGSVEIRGIRSASHTPKNGKCDGGITSFQISSNGDIYPCAVTVNDIRFKLGNVHIPTQIRKSVLDEISKLSAEPVKECLGCKRYDYCRATKCRLINMAYSGNSSQPLPITCLVENISVQTCRLYDL